jgi:hypothetical protein
VQQPYGFIDKPRSPERNSAFVLSTKGESLCQPATDHVNSCASVTSTPPSAKASNPIRRR